MATSKYSDLVLSLITLSGGKDDVIVVHKSFVKFTGSLESGMLLGQMLYWTPRAVARGNWIAKTDREFQEELSLSRYALRQARATLEEMVSWKPRTTGSMGCVLYTTGSISTGFRNSGVSGFRRPVVRFQTFGRPKTHDP